MPESGNVVSDNEKSVNDEFFDKREFKNSKIILAIVIFLVLLVLSLFGTYFYLSRPIRVVTNSINTLYNDFSKFFVSNSSKEIDNMLIDMNFKFDTNLEGFDVLNQESVSYKVGVDVLNKKMYADVFWKEENNNLLGLMFYFLDNKSFLKFDSDDRVFEVDSSEQSDMNFDSSVSNSISREDLRYVSEELKNELINSLDMSVIKRSYETINVSDKNRKVNKLTYPLTSKNLKAIIDSFVSNVCSNSKLLEKLADLYGTDKETLKSNLEKLKAKEFSDVGEFSVYSNLFTTKLMRIEFTNGSVQYGIDFNKEHNSVFVNNGVSRVNFDINSFDSEKINIDFSSNVGLNGSIVSLSNKESENKEIVSLDINFKYFMYDFEINVVNTIQTDVDIPSLDISNSVKLSSSDPTIMESIIANIGEKFANSNLFKIFGSYVDDNSSI